MLKTGAAAGASVAIAGGLSVGMTQVAHASSETTRGYGTTTVQLKDWSLFNKSTGLTMEFTPTDANMGNFMRDVTVNEVGDTHDLFFTDGGTQYKLGPEGFYLVIDENPSAWHFRSPPAATAAITSRPGSASTNTPTAQWPSSMDRDPRRWPTDRQPNPRGRVTRFDATDRRPVDKWTAAPRPTTSPQGQQPQQKRSIHMVHKPVNSNCSRHDATMR